jgi:hypothetical protein
MTMVNLSLMSARGYNLTHSIKLYDLILCPGNIEPKSKWLNCDKLIINLVTWQIIMLRLTISFDSILPVSRE